MIPSDTTTLISVTYNQYIFPFTIYFLKIKLDAKILKHMYATSANEKSMRLSLLTLLNDLSDIELWMKLQSVIDCMFHKTFYIQSSFIEARLQLE